MMNDSSKKSMWKNPLTGWLHKLLFGIVAMLFLPTMGWMFWVDRTIRAVPENIKRIDKLRIDCVVKDDVQALKSLQIQAALLENDLENLRVSLHEVQSTVNDMLLQKNNKLEREGRRK